MSKKPMHIVVLLSPKEYEQKWGAKSGRLVLAEARIIGEMLKEEGITDSEVRVRIMDMKCKSHLDIHHAEMHDYIRVRDLVDRARAYTQEIVSNHWYQMSHVDAFAEVVK